MESHLSPRHAHDDTLFTKRAPPPPVSHQSSRHPPPKLFATHFSPAHTSTRRASTFFTFLLNANFHILCATTAATTHFARAHRTPSPHRFYAVNTRGEDKLGKKEHHQPTNHIRSPRRMYHIHIVVYTNTLRMIFIRVICVIMRNRFWILANTLRSAASPSSTSSPLLHKRHGACGALTTIVRKLSL